MNKKNENYSKEMLDYAIANDMINWDDIQYKLYVQKRKTILDSHPFAIYQGKDGRWRTYVKDSNFPNNRRMIIKSNLPDLEDAVCDYYQAEEEASSNAKITLAILYNEFIDYKKNRVSPTTISTYHFSWKRYYQNSDIINVPIVELTKLVVDNWIHEMIRKYDMDNHQYVNFSCILNQELDLAVEKGIVANNVFKEIKIDKRRVLRPEIKKEDLTQVYTIEEQKQLFELAWSDFYKGEHRIHSTIPLAVMFMFLTGMRVGEVCVLEYDDIHDNYINVNKFWRPRNNEIVLHTKGTFGDRDVILIPEAIKLIEAAQEKQNEHGIKTNYIFSMTDDPAYYDGIDRAFKKYCRHMGITPKSSHKARKTYISTLIDNNVNINTIRKQVGHTNEQTTLKNYCFDRGTPDEVYNKICDALS